jgi:hypothetical protein
VVYEHGVSAGVEEKVVFLLAVLIFSSSAAYCRRVFGSAASGVAVLFSSFIIHTLEERFASSTLLYHCPGLAHTSRHIINIIPKPA